MIRFTVTYDDVAYNDLAREWLDAANREAVTRASYEIEAVLQFDPHFKGEEVKEGLRRIAISPLRALYTVNEGDRIVTVWSFRRFE